MGTVGTWVYPLMWALFCAFWVAVYWQDSDGGDVWLLRRRENELRFCWGVIWSLIGLLVWVGLVYLRTRGTCP